jgi:hypothetical protein
VRSIREVKADGTDVFLGDIDCDRCGYEELNETTEEEKTEKKSLVDANAAKQTGDPSIIWTFGGTSCITRCQAKLTSCLQIILPPAITAKES